MDLGQIKQAIDNLPTDDLLELNAYISQLLLDQPTNSVTKIGVLADIHGDLQNFNKALSIFDANGIKTIICAGDVVDRGSNADEIIKLIRERDIVCIAGNHDRTVVANQERWRQHKNQQKMRQLGRVVSDDTIDFLTNLPDTATLSINGVDILIAHGTPWSDVMTVFPDSRQSTFDRIYKDYGSEFNIIILGHTHHPMHAVISDLHIINPGSIYEVTARDSNTCAILQLPDCNLMLYDLSNGQSTQLDITQR